MCGAFCTDTFWRVQFLCANIAGVGAMDLPWHLPGGGGYDITVSCASSLSLQDQVRAFRPTTDQKTAGRRVGQ